MNAETELAGCRDENASLRALLSEAQRFVQRTGENRMPGARDLYVRIDDAIAGGTDE